MIEPALLFKSFENLVDRLVKFLYEIFQLNIYTYNFKYK